ncbi:DNA cytosine methyltransferase [Sphingomonas sp. MA1305]|nr:DNA cytosine methyltransferase [Sphingomonas sp. MA1305]
MRYLDVCAGISASTVAWKPLGWEAAAYSEIEAAPRAVLAHHYPDTPLHGDFTTIRGDEYGAIDLLVGGTPCQDFSVAGLRAGLDGDRGNLSLEFLRLADRTRPRWVVWENVPGVLSIDGGRAFGAILGGLGELGYGFAYRVLDAQFFGVPQRRRRVFVVGCAGDWRGAAAVLSERNSLSGHPAPRREARPIVAALTRNGVGTCGADDNQGQAGHLIAAYGGNDTRGPIDVATALNTHGGPHGRLDFESETFIAHSLRGEGFDASEDGTGRGTPLVPVYDRVDEWFKSPGSPVRDQCTNSHAAGSNPAPIAYVPDLSATMVGRSSRGGGQTNSPGHNADQQVVATASAVRRLTPRECERLQGFPDDYTMVPHRGKPMADGPRYKALGNSMAVPVMRWIGERITAVEAMKLRQAA